MKKAVLLFMFLCVSVLCCLADEKEQTGENNNTLPLFSFSGLSTQIPVFGFSTMNPVLGTDSLVWKQADLGLTKYSDYEQKSFFEVAKPVFQWGLILGGLALCIAGFSNMNSDARGESTWLGLVTGGSCVLSMGITWLVIDP